MLKIYKLTIFLSIILINKKAYAYLEPGTISLIFQSIIGGLAAAGTFVYIYWLKIKNFILKYFAKKKINKIKDS